MSRLSGSVRIITRSLAVPGDQISFQKAQMMTDHRRELLRIMVRIEQLIAEAESLNVQEADDEVLLRASRLLAEHTCMLAEVQYKLTEMD